MMMKKLFLAALVATAIGVQAQTVNVNQGSVTYAIPATEAGQMPFGNATTLTIGERTYTLNDITNITIDDTKVDIIHPVESPNHICADGTCAYQRYRSYRHSMVPFSTFNCSPCGFI